MRKILSLFLIFFFSLLLLGETLAQENKCNNPQSLGLDEIQKCLDDLNKAKEGSITTTRNLEAQVTGIKNRVAFIENDLAQKAKSIQEGYRNLEKQQLKLNKAIRDYYIKSYYNSPLAIFLSSTSAENITQILTYQKKVADQDKLIITNIALLIVDLEKKKVSLEAEQKSLVSVKADLDKVIADAKIYQGTLSSQIAQLSARQQAILSQRLASLNIPRSAGTSARGCSSDLTNGKDPGFLGGIGFFTYGAPHRNGMNQYGAWGRAKAGQNEEQILSEYYPGLSLKKDYDQGASVNVEGYGTFSIEDYVKRIYEVPDSWTDNNLAVLKAQAVAARTYALNTMQRKGSICTTEACQVFKPDPKGGNWEQAQEATKGWVLMDGGGAGFTQYASTHGGYILNLSKFDGSGGNPGSFSELNQRAYDRESPWFYCNWGSRSEYGGTAWLKTSEIADIINVIMLAKTDGSTGEHLYQTDKPNPAGTDTWGSERVKSELSSKGGNPYANVTDVSISVDFGSGKTGSINVSGDAGSQTFSGAEFKDWFNLRAPSNIQIVGPLYNVERK